MTDNDNERNHTSDGNKHQKEDAVYHIDWFIAPIVTKEANETCKQSDQEPVDKIFEQD